MPLLTLAAPAKINFSLEVLRRRADGFHQVRMLMVGVGLFDKLAFSRRADGRIRLRCNLPGLDTGPSNLVVKAARALMPFAKPGQGADIRLLKRIPLAAGLAGGSSDAAATLKGLNRLWGLRLGLEKMASLAAGLGSDVPFCLRSGWALASGRGEKLSPLRAAGPFWVVLANPGFGVSTPWAYRHVRFREDLSKNYSKSVYKALKEKKIENIRIYAMNDLESATARKYPQIGEMIRLLMHSGAWASRMSGSGPTVWGLFAGPDQAKKALKSLKKNGIAGVMAPTLAKIPSA